jgi:hypothetical protein
MKDEKYLECSSCGTKITIGEEFQHDSNYNAYCQDRSCTDGLQTWGAHLEPCWWDPYA